MLLRRKPKPPTEPVDETAPERARVSEALREAQARLLILEKQADALHRDAV